MSDEIGVGLPAPGLQSTERRVHPIQVGAAVVWIEQVGLPAAVERRDSEEVYAAATVPSPTEIFSQGVHVLRECVRVVGDHLQDLGEATRPQEVKVEFSLSFEASSEGGFIPVFRAGGGVTTGLKVTATWQNARPNPPAQG